MPLQTMALVHKWYEVASRFEKSLELAKAQKSFDLRPRDRAQRPGAIGTGRSDIEERRGGTPAAVGQGRRVTRRSINDVEDGRPREPALSA